MGSGPQDPVSKETHALYDLYMLYINGVERGENDWKKIFQEAGFSGYKIVSGLGIRSAIEVYPRQNLDRVDDDTTTTNVWLQKL
jgi:hypothetical protein